MYRALLRDSFISLVRLDLQRLDHVQLPSVDMVRLDLPQEAYLLRRLLRHELIYFRIAQIERLYSPLDLLFL